MWCCQSLEEYAQRDLDQRGFAIAVRSFSEGKYSFNLLHRSVKKSNEEKMSQDFPIEIENDIVMAFCPFCGKKLEKVYKNKIDQFNCIKNEW